MVLKAPNPQNPWGIMEADFNDIVEGTPDLDKEHATAALVSLALESMMSEETKQ